MRSTTSTPAATAKQGLEPKFRNRFGALPNLGQLSLPSSLSRRSAQLKATKRRPTGTRQRVQAVLVEVEVEVEETASPARKKSETGPCARISQEVWCATPEAPPPAIVLRTVPPTRFWTVPSTCFWFPPVFGSCANTEIRQRIERI